MFGFVRVFWHSDWTILYIRFIKVSMHSVADMWQASFSPSDINRLQRRLVIQTTAYTKFMVLEPLLERVGLWIEADVFAEF